MTAIIFLILAAICKSVADTLQHHYYASVFKNLDPKWWNPAISWKHVKFIPFTKYRADAWHLANSAMIIFMVLAVALHPLDKWQLSWYYEVAIGAAVWNVPFNVFYNKIFR